MKIKCLDCETGKNNKCDKCKYFIVVRAILSDKDGTKDSILRRFLSEVYGEQGKEIFMEK